MAFGYLMSSVYGTRPLSLVSLGHICITMPIVLGELIPCVLLVSARPGPFEFRMIWS